MAECSIASRLAAVSVLVAAAVLFAAATAAAGTAMAVPSYCTRGKAIPQQQSALSACVWYVASRSCDVAAAIFPNRAVLKDTCCQQLQSVPAECRCRALRVMMEAPLVVGVEPRAQGWCAAAQRRFAPAVVSAAECGLRTVHGRAFCNVLDAE